MEQLSRTVSAESTRSWTTPHLLTSGNSTSPANRKARSSEPETGGGNVERASVSMPPPASKAIARAFPSRRASKASDTSLLEHFDAVRHGGSAIAEFDDTTPTLQAARAGSLSLASSLAHPDAHRPPRSDVDAESNRMSFSSLYSIGSAIHPNPRGLSGPSSLAGSEPEGRFQNFFCFLTQPQASSPELLTLTPAQ